MLRGVSDGYNINGSQETLCIKRKGFIPVFVSFNRHKTLQLSKNRDCPALFSKEGFDALVAEDDEGGLAVGRELWRGAGEELLNHGAHLGG